jgi:hypothetical protein
MHVRGTKLRIGAVSALVLVLIPVAFVLSISMSLWSKALVTHIDSEASEQCIRRAVDQIPGMRVDTSETNSAFLFVLHTPNEKYRVATMIKRPNSTSIEVAAYGPATLYFQPWITHGRVLSSLQSLSEAIARECRNKA